MSEEVATRRPANLPPALAEIGVQIATDDSGFRAVVFPPEVRQRCNLLFPVSEIAQADPNFTPSVRIAQLDVQAHAYESTQQRGKFAINKQGLEILGNCAGVLYQKTGRIPKAEIEDTELGYWGEIAIRRSDGTVEPIRREKVVDREVEEYKIRSTVARMDKSDAEKRKIFDNRWLAEREHMRAKCESKALLRAMRAALQIPHLYTRAELQKPFVVVGYSFTPDYDDPETKRLLVAHGLAATNTVYGERRALDAPPPEQRAADRILPSEEQVAAELGLLPGDGGTLSVPEPPSASPAQSEQAGEDTLGAGASPATNDVASTGAGNHGDAAWGGEQESSASPPAPAAPSEPEPPEPAPAAAPSSGIVLDFGRHQGSTIESVYEKEPGYVEWLANSARDASIRDAAMRLMAQGRA